MLVPWGVLLIKYFITGYTPDKSIGILKGKLKLRFEVNTSANLFSLA